MRYSILFYVYLALICVLSSQSNCQLNSNTVMFSVAITTDEPIKSGDIVKDDFVYTNNGNGYNSTAEIFSSPEKKFLFAPLAAKLVVPCVDAKGVVTFSAGLNRSMNVRNGEIIKYDDVFINVGCGYNPITGIFTSPHRGSYFFSFHGLGQPSNTLCLILYKNSDQVVSIWGSVTSNYASASNSVILPLKKGDTVYIKTDREYNFPSFLYTYTTFSGYKISA